LSKIINSYINSNTGVSKNGEIGIDLPEYNTIKMLEEI
jgi:hypothetical protein